MKTTAANSKLAIGCFSSPLDSFEEQDVHFSEQTFVMKSPLIANLKNVNFNCND
jgi:hypothetical protein